MSATSDLSADAAEFIARLPFQADRFQLDAIEVLDRGESVVVTAPTGAGKTLIAEAAVHLARASGLRSFYTAPIKALSNQKFSDFRRTYGEDEVGLLTGDNVINGEAPVVVMTTEVLRNMIYAGSDALANLGVVILDEVHYLQDRYRGSVWEEVIIHLPAGIPLVNLSATVSNSSEFRDWIAARRGPTGLVTETLRPVPLEPLYLLSDRYEDYRLAMLPIFNRSGTRLNSQLDRMLKKSRGRKRRFVTPRWTEVAADLAREQLLPAIYFIFSRAGCDRAAATVAAEGPVLTSPDERREIIDHLEHATAHISAADLTALGYDAWSERLERGVGAHHAGMVPAFKEAVEQLFVRGLVKLVFATETLALGINMPARAVVLEQMSKFNGESHETLTRGEFTQLTGRAGRRGIDTSGTALVLHDGRLPFDRVAAVAAPGSEAMRSSFQPSYNMAVNLVANYERDHAEELLSASFAQYRHEHRRAELEARISSRRDEVEDFRSRAGCDLGDIWEYLALAGPDASRGASSTAKRFIQKTRAGDVVTFSGTDRWVLMARSWGASPRLLLLSAGGEVKRVTASDLGAVFGIVGRLRLPEPVRTRDDKYLSRLRQQLETWEPEASAAIYLTSPEGRDHPVAECPDLAEHQSWVRRMTRSEKEIGRLEKRLRKAEGGLVASFRAIERVLRGRGFLEGWTLTPKGERLRYVYNELDLLLAESAEAGVFDGLDAAEFAAIASMFTFEPRKNDVEEHLPNRRTAAAGSDLLGLWEAVVSDEDRQGVPLTRRPEPGFAATAHGWASGHDLADLFDDEARAGDFVRNSRQLLDLLRQLRDAYPDLAAIAGRSIRSIDRGIVGVGGRF